MKVHKREVQNDKRARVMKEMRRKIEKREQILNKTKNFQENIFKEKEERQYEQERRIKEKIDEHFKLEDEKRLEEGKRSEEKLMMFSTNNLKYLQTIKETFVQRTNKSMTNFQNHYKTMQVKNEEILQEKKEKSFQKFEKFYFHLKSVKEHQKEKKEKNVEKMSNKKERLDELEYENKKKSQSVMQKLNEFERRRKEVFEKQAQKFHQIVEKEHNDYKKLLVKKGELGKDRKEKNKMILEIQQDVLHRANLKDHTVNLNRLNAHENTVLTQMELGKKLNSFYTQMNSLKDQSVLKLSKEQRKRIYIDMKRKEEIKKKKDEEERQKLLGLA